MEEIGGVALLTMVGIAAVAVKMHNDSRRTIDNLEKYGTSNPSEALVREFPSGFFSCKHCQNKSAIAPQFQTLDKVGRCEACPGYDPNVEWKCEQCGHEHTNNWTYYEHDSEFRCEFCDGYTGPDAEEEEEEATKSSHHSSDQPTGSVTDSKGRHVWWL